MVMLRFITTLSVFLLVLNAVSCDYIEEPGPRTKPTQGAVWPKPQEQTFNNEIYSLNPYEFKFQNEINDCANINAALQRYKNILVKSLPKPWKKNRLLFRGETLSTLKVFLNGTCETPLDTNMDEHYELNVVAGSDSRLIANTYWGVIRGLETFSQLVFLDEKSNTIQIKGTKIVDYPRFSHRGLLLDTSRHFMPVKTIIDILDAMSYNKMNVFHWHIVDDQSFPYQSITFPELSEKGAFHQTMVYSQTDIATIIAYAKTLGIRVMPEFDSPGHTRSWGVSHPEILTACYKDGKPDGTYGAIDPTLNTTYTFFENLLKEISEVFLDKYLHLGGDEVGFNCWLSNPELMARMEFLGIENVRKLEEVFIQRLVDMTTKLGASALVWQEVFDNGVILPNGTIVHIWVGDHRQKLDQVTGAGLPALLSTCWYLSQISGGGDWNKYYNCDPWDFPGDEKQKKLVLGGEACMWAEYVDKTNVLQRIWPRASAVAEKLWSAQNADNTNEASKRLEEHSCRMNRRGIPSQPPNGPGYCLM